MNKAILFNFLVDKENNQIKVERSFEAPLDLVWAAWTEAAILDQWWAPKPYKAVTKSMDFTEGGRWHYYMLSPEGEKHWCLFDFDVIKPQISFSGSDAFCDEHVVRDSSMPQVRWENAFKADGEDTLVNILLTFKTLEDLETIVQMGFKEGFAAGLENLDQYFRSVLPKRG
ncbi:SRPBCC family protein [Rufibacter roseolus]|uniref:SRPBCC family protein n=1 Tax=Rufibacter roseolus TaxID=2817375 RepID=UPI001B316E0F|nr:SRPBCC domain-containing protein [Rufibacter roseolus]